MPGHALAVTTALLLETAEAVDFYDEAALKFIYNVATLIVTHSLATELTVTDFTGSRSSSSPTARTTELTVTHEARPTRLTS